MLFHTYDAQDWRYEKKKQDSHYQSDNHKPDTIPPFLLIFFFGSRKNKEEYRTDKGIDTSYDDCQNHAG